jgi:hypothetical protein
MHSLAPRRDSLDNRISMNAPSPSRRPNSSAVLANAPRLPTSPLRRLLFTAVYLFYLCVLIWLGIFGYLYFAYMIPPSLVGRGLDINQIYYPEVIHSGALEAAEHPEQYHVVLLGGSTLEQTAEEFQAELARQWGPDIRVHNLAKSAHTSRDSLIKFQRLPDQGIDLVVLYDGFNDIRLNCVPAADYRPDYTHCGWYARLEQHLNAGQITIRQVLQRDAAALSRVYDHGGVAPELLDEGANIKTAAAFRANLAGILEACARRRIPVVLMSFAAFLPENYNREDFLAGKLAYGDGDFHMDAESWGRPENIRRTLAAHNAAIKALADEPQYEGIVRFVDQEHELPASDESFCDPCHLTPAGIRRFVQNVLRHFPERPTVAAASPESVVHQGAAAE